MILKFSTEEKRIGRRLYQKFMRLRKKNERLKTASFKQLFDLVTVPEAQILEAILSVKNSEVGKTMPFYGFKSPPRNLVRIKPQTYLKNGEKKKTGVQFLPLPVYLAYKRLNKAITKDLGKPLVILSAYRSPAYQLALFFVDLCQDKWNFKKTLSYVALPGYSEHGYPDQQAIDFGTYHALKLDADFEKTKEYRWLQKNASRFGFHLSFPRGNKTGVIFEPWHWHYNKKRKT